MIIAGISAALAVVLGALAAYPLARLSFRARRPLLQALLGSQSVPGLALLMPLYIMLAGIQGILGITVIGSYPAIIAVYMTFGLPLATVVCFVYLRSMPRDLEDAALVDGCTRLGALRKVVAPLMAPAMVVSLVFAFLVGWNDVLFASALQNQTIAVTLEQFGLAQAEGVGAQPLYGDQRGRRPDPAVRSAHRGRPLPADGGSRVLTAHERGDKGKPLASGKRPVRGKATAPVKVVECDSGQRSG